MAARILGDMQKMMHRIDTTAMVDSDGAITINQSLGIPPGRHRVVLLIDEGPAEQTRLDWPSFVKATYGSLVDIPIARESERPYEQRDKIGRKK